jgi:hypothetical protein
MESEEKTLIHIAANNNDELIFKLDIDAILELDIYAIFSIKSRLDNFNWKLNQIIDEIMSSSNNCEPHDCENCDNKDNCEDNPANKDKI